MSVQRAAGVGAERFAVHVEGRIGPRAANARVSLIGYRDHLAATTVVDAGDLLRAIVADALPTVTEYPEQGGYVRVQGEGRQGGAAEFTLAPPRGDDAAAHHTAVALQHLALAEYARTHPAVNEADLLAVGAALDATGMLDDLPPAQVERVIRAMMSTPDITVTAK